MHDRQPAAYLIQALCTQAIIILIGDRFKLL